MSTIAFIERVDPLLTRPDCVRDDEGHPVIYATYVEGLKALAESIVESQNVRLADAEAELDSDQKISLYEDVCHGGPISDYYICEVQVLDDGTIIDGEHNRYWQPTSS